MKRIKVTHLVFSLSAGGLENGVVNLCNRLDPEIFDTSICVLEGGGELEDRLDRERVKLYEVRRHFGNDPSVPLRIAGQLWRRGADILHTHNWVTLVEGSAATTLARVPVLIHGEHGYPMEERARNVKVQRFLWSKAVTQLLSVSGELAEAMSKLTGLSRDLIEVLPNGVDTTKFQPQPADRANLRAQFGLPAEGIMIGMVARLVPVKNHAGAIDALARLRQQGIDAHLVLAGRGELETPLREQARAENVEDVVHFLGFRDDIDQVYNALDIFLLNSHREGMSNTIVEAMACGVPVVASDVGANAESIVEGETGFLVPPDAPEELAAALGKLVDAELRARFATAARRRIEENFSIASMVQRYSDLYVRLTRPRTSPQGVVAEASPATEQNVAS